MHLLQSAIDPSLIALYLGHETIETTHIYYAQTADMCSRRSNPLIAGRHRLV